MSSERSHRSAASGAGDPSSIRLLADVHSDGDRFVIEVDLPGVKPEKLEVYAIGDTVVVEGAKEERKPPRSVRPKYERAERDYGPFRRVFELPGPADLSQALATLATGVLRISVPRIIDRRGRARRIRVTVES
jgi:HSP20 family protein